MTVPRIAFSRGFFSSSRGPGSETSSGDLPSIRQTVLCSSSRMSYTLPHTSGTPPVHPQQAVDGLHGGAHGVLGGEYGVPRGVGELAQEGEVHTAVGDHICSTGTPKE